jgi:hypothetical protein
MPSNSGVPHQVLSGDPDRRYSRFGEWYSACLDYNLSPFGGYREIDGIQAVRKLFPAFSVGQLF